MSGCIMRFPQKNIIEKCDVLFRIQWFLNFYTIRHLLKLGILVSRMSSQDSIRYLVEYSLAHLYSQLFISWLCNMTLWLDTQRGSILWRFFSISFQEFAKILLQASAIPAVTYYHANWASNNLFPFNSLYLSWYRCLPYGVTDSGR